MLYIGVLLVLVLQFLRPQEFVEAIYGQPVVLITMLVLLPPWLLTLTKKKLLRTPIDLFLFLFYITCIASYWNWKKSAFYEPVADFGKIFLIYLFVVHVIDTRRRLTIAVWTVMFMLVLVALLAGPIALGPKAGTYASFGSFSDRNDFGGALATILPFAVVFCLKGNPLEKMLASGVLVAATRGVILSDSRGSQLAAIAGMCAALYVLGKSKMSRRVVLVVAIAAFAVALGSSRRLGSITRYTEDESAMGRIYAWQDILTNFPRYPITGRGFGKYIHWMPGGRDTHSSYMRALGELGAPGLFCYLGVLFFAWREARGLTKPGAAPHPTIHLLAVGMTGGLAAHIVASIFLTHLYYPFVLVQIALIGALRLITDRERVEAHADDALIAGAGPGPQRNLWEASVGMGLLTRRLISRKDLMKILAVTIGCVVFYKIMVEMSV